MRFKTGRGERVEVNLTPLIDVVFLLLIFFMVTTTFEHRAQLEINLPEATAEPQPQPQEPLELLINQQGEYHLDGQALVNAQRETLASALRQASAQRTEQPLVIRADARTPHQAVVTAMDVAAKLGLTRLSIATTRADETP